MFSLLVAERGTFWRIAIFYRDEELNSPETVQEEDDPKTKTKNKSSLEIREICDLFTMNRLSNRCVAVFWNS